jgi:hypothetical protein
VPCVVGAFDPHWRAGQLTFVRDGDEQCRRTVDGYFVRRGSQLDVNGADRSFCPVPKYDRPGGEQDPHGDGEKHVFLDTGDTTHDPQYGRDPETNETSVGRAETPTCGRYQRRKQSYSESDRHARRSLTGSCFLFWRIP